jgi:hypothetical protein
LVNTLLDSGLDLGVQGTGPFVDEHDLGLLDEHAGEHETLPLTA